ncbi:MAG: ATP synthase F1 subunit delta [Acidimicrobiia bacterium]
MSERIQVYAKSLVDIARIENRLADVEDELFAFAQAVRENDNLRMTLTDPNIDAPQRVGVVDQLLEGKALPMTKGIVALIVMSEHAGNINEIVDAFITRSAHIREKETAEIRTAVELDEETKNKLVEALSKATGKNLDAKIIVDESIVGGVVAKVGDQVIDGTLRHRLSKLKETIDG